MRPICRLVALCCWVTAATWAATVAAADPLDWPNWRGPNYDGTSTETGLIDSWDPATGENVVWVRKDLFARSTPIVLNGKLYFQTRANPATKIEGERVVCLDATTGETLWENKFGVYLSDVPDTRVGWCSVTGDPETGNIYAQGVCGIFLCIDGETGKTLWSRSMHEEFGLLTTYGGRTNTPVVFDDLVIASGVMVGWREFAVPAHRMVAFNKKTGEVRWINGTSLSPPDTTYSMPVVCKLNGQDAIVFGSSDGGVHAFQPRTGKQIWSYGFSRRGINVTPTVHNGTVYIGHAEEQWAESDSTMGAIVAIDGTRTGDITADGAKWKHTQVMIGRSSPLVVDDKVYVIDDRAGLWIFDAETGKQPFNKTPRLRYDMKLGRGMFGSPLYADGKIYVCTSGGEWWILKPDPKKGVEVVQKMLRLNTEVNGSPIVSHGKIYLATGDGIYCLGKKDQAAAQATAGKSQDAQPAKPEDQKPTHVQVSPADVLLAPGQSQQFTVRLYNAAGEFLSETKADFSVDRGGNVTADGLYTSDKDYTHKASVVTAKVGDLTGSARIRVVGDLPWSFDFSDGVIPEVWVGMRNRHIVVDFDLANSLRTTNQLAHELYLYFSKAFVDSGRSSLAYTAATRPVRFQSLLKFLDLDGYVNTQDEAQSHLNEALDLLVREKVLSSYKWVGEPNAPGLSVEKGPRAIENAAAVKLDRIPVPAGFTQLGTRSQGWMGPTHLHDYTVEMDFCAVEDKGKLPALGLNNQRYQVEVSGPSQLVEIRTWFAQKRMANSTPFQWKSGTWYRLKFQSENLDDRVVLRAKVWPRDSEEPAEWTVTAEDLAPERVGSPGFWGNCQDTEFFFDNVKVYKNK